MSQPPSAGAADQRPVGRCGLPLGVADFTARGAELAALRALAARIGAGEQGTPRVALISGMAGIGKTTLAVRAAQALRDDFPDGVRYLDLGQSDARARDPNAALRVLLQDSGLPPESLPSGRDERLGLYRAVTQHWRGLLVLDNASSESQVRALLPSGSGSLTLVTSRRLLSGLESVRRLVLEPFDAQATAEFLAQLLGRARVGREQEASGALSDLCGGLPLALRIVGQRLALRPGLSLAEQCELLRDDRHRLDLLAAGDLRVVNAFHGAYQRLDAPARAMFRALALLPCASFSAELAAAAAGCDPADATARLDRLAEAGLVQPAGGGDAYGWHDLLRLYARRLVDADGADVRALITSRVAEWLAARIGTLGTAVNATTMRGDPVRRAAAVARLDAELPGYWPALRLLDEPGRERQLIQLALAMHWYSDIRVHLVPWDDLFERAVAAAVRVGDVRAEARMRNFLGWALRAHRTLVSEGLREHRTALRLTRQCGDVVEQAWSWQYLGAALFEMRKADLAVGLLRRGLALFQARGEQLGAAICLYTLACDLMLRGENEHAAGYLERSLELTADAAAEVRSFVLTQLGQALSAMGQHDRAIGLLGDALALCRHSGFEDGEVNALRGLGAVLHGAGRDVAAVDALHECLAVERRRGNDYGQALICRDLARLSLDSGDAAAAVGYARRGVELCDRGYGSHRGRLRRLLDDLIAAAGTADVATLGVPAGREAAPKGAARPVLTAHERRVVTLAMAGQTNRQIAAAFGVTVRAVELQLTGVYRKLGISRRPQLSAALAGLDRPRPVDRVPDRPGATAKRRADQETSDDHRTPDPAG